MIALPVEGRRYLAIVQHDASELEKAAFRIVVTYMTGNFTYTEKAETYYMYGHTNGNGKTVLR